MKPLLCFSCRSAHQLHACLHGALLAGQGGALCLLPGHHARRDRLLPGRQGLHRRHVRGRHAAHVRQVREAPEPGCLRGGRPRMLRKVPTGTERRFPAPLPARWCVAAAAAAQRNRCHNLPAGLQAERQRLRLQPFSLRHSCGWQPIPLNLQIRHRGRPCCQRTHSTRHRYCEHHSCRQLSKKHHSASQQQHRQRLPCSISQAPGSRQPCRAAAGQQGTAEQPAGCAITGPYAQA
jgi:hypothetical protein